MGGIKPRWPSPVRRWSRKPLVRDLGSSNLSLGAILIPLRQSSRSLIIVSIHQCWHSFRYACAVFNLNLPLPRLRSLHQDRTVNLFHASPPEWAEGYISASDLPSVLDHLLFFRPSPRDGGYNGTRSFFLQGCPLPVLRMTSSVHCVLR